MELCASQSGGGGGGFGSPSLPNNNNKRRKGKDGSTTSNKKKQRKLISIQELANENKETTMVPSKTYEREGMSPVLDKWGLPPPTLQDIFPPLPKETELIPYHHNDVSLQKKEQDTLAQKIEQAMQNHVLMSTLPRWFDEEGMERRSPKQIQQQHTAGKETDKDDNDKERPRMQLKLMHISPPVLVIENFLTPQECKDIEQVTQLTTTDKDGTKKNHHHYDNNNNNKESETVVQVNSATFQGSLSTRTSTSWFCQFATVPTLIEKLHSILGFVVEHMEEPQIVRYQNGQEFSWHYDQVPLSSSSSSFDVTQSSNNSQQQHVDMDNGGQRLATVLVYLNSLKPQCGGATIFRDLQQPISPTTTRRSNHQNEEEEKEEDNNNNNRLTIHPKQGRACFFFPAFVDGRPDDRTLHKGEKVAILQDTRQGKQKKKNKKKKNVKSTTLSSSSTTTTTTVERRMGNNEDMDDDDDENHNDEKRIVQVWIHQRPYRPILPPGNTHDKVLELINSKKNKNLE